MKQIENIFADLPLKRKLDEFRWAELCQKYLPCRIQKSIWRYSRWDKIEEPPQGWKLHISATVLNACDIFEKIAPLLFALDVQFKAPISLDELLKINSGLHFGYSQVGKFVTIYPENTEQAVRLAKKIHGLTMGYASPAVPFDEQFLPYSCVYYRYGAFRSIKITKPDGETEACLRNPKGDLVPDNRFQAIPDWLSDPFKKLRAKYKKRPRKNSPLNTKYQIIRALTQRGKGGVYLAMDLSMKMPRLCIVKEGRRNGEANWNGFDGHELVKNECHVLGELEKIDDAVPKVLGSFEINENYYLIMEYVEGESLRDIMKLRRRRFSIKQTVKFSLMIARIIERLHKKGWAWTDCKPANLIVTPGGDLRPLDFEGAHPIGSPAKFDWRTAKFSMLHENPVSKCFGEADDLYALGAVSYFLLTGKYFRAEEPVPIKQLRRNVPESLERIVNKLTDLPIKRKKIAAAKIRLEFEELWQKVFSY